MESKQQEIINVAREMFGEYGIRSVSVDDICRQVGISKKTLYQYYNNKAELLDSLLTQEMENVKNEALEIKAEANNAIHSLLLVSKLIGRLSMNAKPAAAYDLKKYYPELYKKFVDIKRQMAYEGIVMNLERGMKEGLYRSDLSIEVIARLYIQKIEQMHDKEFLQHMEFSHECILKIMFENHIRGIANQKGIEVFEKEKENLNFKIDDTSA